MRLEHKKKHLKRPCIKGSATNRENASNYSTDIRNKMREGFWNFSHQDLKKENEVRVPFRPAFGITSLLQNLVEITHLANKLAGSFAALKS